MSETLRFVGMTVGELEETCKRSASADAAAVAEEVLRELARAIQKNGPMHGPHEGYAVILEELDELWDLVKAYPKRATREQMRGEAVQVAAMAVRFVLDVCGPRLEGE